MGADGDPPAATPLGAGAGGDPIHGRIHRGQRTRPTATPMGVDTPVPRSRTRLRLAVHGRIHGIWGRRRYAREREASKGREGAGQREREVGTGEKGGIKISLTGGVHV
jgi:hypothetical protein